jgi:CBS domain-containing protein
MARYHVGAVVIVDLQRPIGIVTDRDLALRIVAAHRPGEVPIRDVMSTDLVVAHTDQQLDTIVFKMREHGVRRLPLVDGSGALAGLVSLDDLEVLLAGELSSVAHAVLDNRGP